MATQKIEYGLPAVVQIATVFGFVGISMFFISVFLWLNETKGLYFCFSFVFLSIFTIPLCGAGVTFAKKEYVDQIIRKTKKEADNEIKSSFKSMLSCIVIPMIALPFDKNLFQNIPYTVVFVIFYVVSLFYVMFLYSVLKSMFFRIFGDVDED